MRKTWPLNHNDLTKSPVFQFHTKILPTLRSPCWTTSKQETCIMNLELVIANPWMATSLTPRGNLHVMTFEGGVQ